MSGNEVFPAGATLLMRAVELHSIDFVPESERHGSLMNQGTFWFLGNFNFATIATGFIGPTMGLSLPWTILAETLGILIGTVFQAFHASQGAELGLPQMIQSRAQFGFRGVVVPLCASLFTFVGFNIVNTILIASGMHAIAGWSLFKGTVVSSVAGVALAVCGHDWLHRTFKLMFWASVPLFVALTLAILWSRFATSGGAAAWHPDAGRFVIAGFFTQLAAGVSYNITYAAFVSDYTRYLPPITSRTKIIGTVFLASAVSAIWLIAIGGWLAVHFGLADTLSDLLRSGDAVQPGFGLLLAAVSIGALVLVIGMNAYSAMLTILTAIDAFHPLRPTRRARVVAICLITVLSAFCAVDFGGDVIAVLNNYFVVMLYLLVPWTAVNLTDYFYVRRGVYAVTDLLSPGGIYDHWERHGLLAYAVGFAASAPFCVLPGWYVGPAAHALGDIDVGWVVGLGVTVATYLWLTRHFDPQSEWRSVQTSKAALSRIGVEDPA